MRFGSIFFVGLMGLAMCGPSFAAQSELPVDQWEVGPEAYYFQYKEPSFNVKTDGIMYGVAGSYTHHNYNHWMIKADGQAAWGGVDYGSTVSGTVNGIDDTMLEGRVVEGYDIYLQEDVIFTPFFGSGYRYLNDDSSGKISSTGAHGYERESNYFYSPVGVEFSSKFEGDWDFGAILEYDLLWIGQQKSHLENVASGLNTVSNDQNSGYGFRGSVKFQKKGDQFDLLIEPFVRWWNVKDSQESVITYTGAIVGYAYEPKNETFEAGGKISLIF